MSDLTNHIQSLLMRTCNDPKCRSDHRKDAVAAIALVLEEAAKLADDEATHCEETGSPPSDFGNAGRNDAAKTIAAAIRALGEKQ